jgi:hypothetical protein
MYMILTLSLASSRVQRKLVFTGHFGFAINATQGNIVVDSIFKMIQQKNHERRDHALGEVDTHS